MVSFEEFKKLQIKVAVIETVAPHPKADRLYVLGIKVGDEKKNIVAGIRQFYKEQELQNKKIVIVDNLEPASIRGIESQGMLLAASEGDILTLIVPERPISDGATVC